MKKWILAALAVLLVWNVILTIRISSNAPRPAEGDDVTENVVVDYSTDLSEMADEVRAGVVTVSSRINGLMHTCSGIIFAAENDGVYVFTSDQITYEATDVTVTFDSGAAAEAEVVAVDPPTASALLKINPTFEVTPLKMAAAQVIRQGEYAAVMGGRSPVTNSAPVSFGVISQPGQRRLSAGSTWFADVLDTDALTTQEMVGGPLLNIGGQLIGMLVSKTVSGDRFALALSVSEMQMLYDEFLAEGKATRGSLGIAVRPVSEMMPYEKSERDIRLDVLSGVLVTYLSDSTEAEGILETADIITAINGTEITDEVSLRTELYAHESGDTVSLTLLRGTETEEVSVILQ